MLNGRNSFSVPCFLAGIGVGGTLALLLAPKSGNESQEWITERTREGVSQMKAKGRDLRRQAHDLIDRGTRRAAEAVQAGKDAYREATE